MHCPLTSWLVKMFIVSSKVNSVYVFLPTYFCIVSALYDMRYS